MKKLLLLTTLLALASPALAGSGPADPFRIDPGEKNDRSAFLEWLADPANSQPHPLMWLRAVDRSRPTQRKGYFAFFDRQAGLTKAEAATMHRLCDDLFALDIYLSEPYHTDGQQKDIEKTRARIKADAEWFFGLPRARRVKIYCIAEKFEDARLILMDLARLQQSEIDDTWMQMTREQEMQSRKGYLFGMLEGRDQASADAVVADFKATIEYLLTFTNPPKSVKGKALTKLKARQKKRRALILKKTGEYAF